MMNNASGLDGPLHNENNQIGEGRHGADNNQPALDSSVCFSTETQRKSDTTAFKTGRRRSRVLRKVFRQHSTRKAERLCGVGLAGGSAQIVASRKQCHSKLFGAFFCKSTSCPGCAFHRNVELVNRLVPALEGAAVAGHSIFFLTLTLRHDKTTEPEVLLKGFSKCWNATNTRLKRFLKKDVGRTDLKGGGLETDFPGGRDFEYFWARDYTWSKVNGHHFHLHGLLVVKNKMTVDQVAGLQEELFRSWNKAAVRDGFGECSRDAFYLELVNAGSMAPAVSRYVAKLTKTAFETVSGDWKRGKESLSQFQMLEQLHKTPDATESFKIIRKAYRSHRKATFGKRTYSNSKGFFKMADLRELVDQVVEEEHIPELTPDPLDVLSNLEVQKDWNLYTIIKPLWKVMVRYGDTEDVQSLLEDGACGQLQSTQDAFGYARLVKMLDQVIKLSQARKRLGTKLHDDELIAMWEDFRTRFFIIRFSGDSWAAHDTERLLEA